MRLTRCTARTSSSLRNRLTSLFDAAGNQTGTIDARGNLTQYLYDASNRSTVTIDAASNRTTQLLDSAGRVSGVLDGNNHLTQYLFDALNRASVTIDGDGHRTTSLFDGAGNLTGTLDGRGNLTQYLIDADNRASVTVDASSDRTTTLFDPAGNATVVIDGNGNRTTYLFDALNRATVTINADGYRTTQLLDAAGNLTGMVDADSNLTTFAYDGLNRKIGATNPQSYPATFMYNGVGMLTESIDALGRIIKNQYDADYRLTTVIWEDATGTPTQTFLFSYDAASNQTSAGNSVGTYTMMYDAVGRVSGVQELWNQQLTFSYDGVGNRTKVQDSFGGVTTNVFDNANNLATLLFSGTGQTPPMRTDLTYNGDNQIASLTRYSDLNANTNVAFTSYSYDPAGRLTNQVTLKGSDNSNIANLSYSYDPGGRVTNEITNGTTVSDAYDAANQLIGDGTTTVAFDGSGNRNNGSYQVGTENQVTQDATWKYTYDAAGNETKKVNITAGQGSGNAWVYTYDDGNELTKAELLQYDPAVYGTGDPVLKEVDYKYDAFGNMAERDDYPTGSGNPTVTRYAQDGWDPPLAGTDGNTRFNVWAELDGNNNLLTRYLHGDQPDQLFARQDSLVAYWYVTDNLGSVRDVLDNTGAVKDALSYDGWGNITSESNNTYRGNYAYTGRQWDIETQLQYDRARWYGPATGRWQTQDPIGFGAGDSNLYRYVTNEPVAATDPSGTDIMVLFGPDIKAANLVTVGHPALLIGNPASGYKYFSFHAGAFSTLTDNLEVLDFGTITEAKQSVDLSYYKDVLIIKSSASEDKAAIAYAEAWYGRTYRLALRNCSDFVSDVVRHAMPSIGFPPYYKIFGGPLKGTILKQLGLSGGEWWPLNWWPQEVVPWAKSRSYAIVPWLQSAPATIVLHLPQSAQFAAVFFDNHATRSTGLVRTYTTPPLPGGFRYQYEIAINRVTSWFKRLVHVVGGKTTTVLVTAVPPNNWKARESIN